jgi:hypothetical protein
MKNEKSWKGWRMRKWRSEIKRLLSGQKSWCASTGGNKVIPRTSSALCFPYWPRCPNKLTKKLSLRSFCQFLRSMNF